ncbi:hypothetical protein HYH96_17495 [Clostridium botulinum]|uniref:Uncharacterized protein n=1 Tax=Clostridium botulinum TaxID=1491 RepID=A0A6B4NQT0_CLOBO|nr:MULTISPECIES: hypothetical protein [Clostridium]ACA57447.1 conserved hypothetical protein [Clostridium botulinum A3 str. Loch Maree]APR02827.1 hypothetical protein RSJ2_3720 [Clostridium botulinum]AUN19860.1 hypothetical protein B2M06_20180 [Clostridium botulinum]EPS54461.1 hypothetical protein CLQ_14278 [Clostridium botulinum Af84]KEI94211.1 hypothetical protein N494_19075 [Clostridium botulinum A2B7 92]
MNILTNTLLTVNTQLPNASSVSPVSPAEFGQRSGSAIDSFTQAFGGMIVPLIMLAFIISIIVFLIGTVVQSKNLRKVGAGGIGGAILGFILYIASPLILGLIYHATQTLRG